MRRCAASWTGSPSPIRRWTCGNLANGVFSSARRPASCSNLSSATRPLNSSHPQIGSTVVPNRPLRHAPARPADSPDDLVAASTLGELERHARAKAARASYEFWNTGDEALLKRAFAENFADRAVWPPRAPATIDVRPSRRLGASEKEST